MREAHAQGAIYCYSLDLRARGRHALALFACPLAREHLSRTQSQICPTQIRSQRAATTPRTPYHRSTFHDVQGQLGMREVLRALPCPALPCPALALVSNPLCVVLITVSYFRHHRPSPCETGARAVYPILRAVRWYLAAWYVHHIPQLHSITVLCCSSTEHVLKCCPRGRLVYRRG